MNLVSPVLSKYENSVTKNIMTKQFSSIVKVEFAYNNRAANSKEEYIDLLKKEFIETYDIQLEEHEITEIKELNND